MSVKYVHTNIIAKDWHALSDFYINVFDCAPLPPERNLSGEWLDSLTKFKNCKIQGIHLALPGYTKGPTLEIFSYEPENADASARCLNSIGLAHTAFHVDNVGEIIDKLINNGGKIHGELVSNDYGELGILTVAYASDPEGNFIEIQNWTKN
ncbi:MAG: VOC family protein [Eubacteriaceae bacterium]|nr:VOC family protein [Eubacteriaceae bacterium]